MKRFKNKAKMKYNNLPNKNNQLFRFRVRHLNNRLYRIHNKIVKIMNHN